MYCKLYSIPLQLSKSGFALFSPSTRMIEAIAEKKHSSCTKPPAVELQGSYRLNPNWSFSLKGTLGSMYCKDVLQVFFSSLVLANILFTLKPI